MKSAGITLELTQAEALVLFEWLARNEMNLPVEDPAEQEMLWRVKGRLEERVAQVFAPNYRELLSAARAEVNAES